MFGSLILVTLAWAQPNIDRLTQYFHEGKHEELIAEGEPLAKELWDGGDREGAARIYQMLTIVYLRLGRQEDMLRCNAIVKEHTAEENLNSGDPQARERAISDKAAALFSSGDLPRTLAFVDEHLKKLSPHSPSRYWLFQPKYYALWVNNEREAALAALATEIATLEAALASSHEQAKEIKANLGLTCLLGSTTLAYRDPKRSIALGQRAKGYLLGENGSGIEGLPGSPNLGYRLAAASGDFAEALALADAYSAQFSQARFHPHNQAQIGGRRGYWLEKTGQEADALSEYLRAIEFLDGAWSRLKLRENKESLISRFEQGEFFPSTSFIFERAIALAIKLGHHQKALELSEKYKSRSVRESLSREALEKVDPPDVEKSLLAEERSLYKQLLGNPDPKIVTTYFAVIQKIAVTAPEYANLLVGDPGDLRLPKLEEGDVLVEYFLTADRVYSFILKPGESIRVVETEVTRDEIERLVEDSRKNLKQIASVRVLRRSLGALSQAVLAPVEHELVGASRVIFVPHGKLHYVPFSALPTQDGKYLVENLEVLEAPSAHVLSFGQSKNPRRASAAKNQAWPTVIFALGNLKVGTWVPLPGTSAEAEILKQLLPDARIFLGRELQHNQVLQEMPRGQIIHFATHGFYEASSPLSSGLVTADRPVTVADLIQERLEAYSVFLSACETALGKETGADELVGLQQSFTFAGTPSVIATLWQISDEATVELVENFYRELKTSPKSAALRKAQLALLQSERFHHPFYWSAFVLSGDWI